MKDSLIAALLPIAIGIATASAGELRDVREAAIDALRESPNSEFPVDGVPLRASTPATADAKTWHFRTGVPFGVGALNADDRVELFRGDTRIPVQTEVLATWGPPDSEFGTAVKWLGVDFVDAVSMGESPEYRLKLAKASRPDQAKRSSGNGEQVPERRRDAPRSGLRVHETDATITIDDPRQRIKINKTGRFNLFESVLIDGKVIIAPGQCQGAYIVDGQGRRFHAKHDRTAKVEVEMQGPFAVVVRAEGWFVNPDVEIEVPPKEPAIRPKGGFCRFVTRIYIAANQPDVRVQHTFILTEDSEKTTYQDIGISLPGGVGAKAKYGGVEGEHDGHTFLLQESWDKFKLLRGAGLHPAKDSDNRQAKNPPHVTGERAEGWFTAGSLGVCVRDFWQNFPTELEVDPVAGELCVHFWPEHGAPRMETAETLSDDNAWRLPFVHSGDKLDFRIPEVLNDASRFKELHGGGYVEAMYKANAIGVAKTHDLLISFDTEREFTQRADLFQLNPQVLPDPEYIASTRVFGPIPASDPKQFPMIEHRFNNSMKWVIRSKDAFGSFGMWNYGDVQTYFKTQNGIVWPGYRRLWAATHYNNPRVAWWLAWRSGDHEILQHARRETQHIIDVDLCHWTNELFESREHQPVYHSRKSVGGICDYKGVVHWHAGDRYAYNACVDFMLYDFYLTGNRRAWDVVHEHGRYITRKAEQNIGRGAAGQSDAMVEYYKATWDPQVGEKLRHHAERVMATPADRHDQMLDWTPWLPRYWDLTHDPAARDYLLDWVDHRGGGRLQNYAYAYYITGDRKYARHCAETILLNSLTTAVRDDEFDGTIGFSWKSWTDGVTAELLSLKAGRAADLTLADFQPTEWPYWIGWNITAPYTLNRDLVARYFGGTFPWPDQDKPRITAVVYHGDTSPQRKQGSAATTPLWLGSIQQDPDGVKMRVTAPDGSITSQFHRPGYWRVIRGSSRDGLIALRKTWPPGATAGDKVKIEGREFTVDNYRQVVIESHPLKSHESLYELASRRLVLDEKHATGFYTITYDGGTLQPVRLLPPDRKVWLKVGAESTMVLSGLQFFYVPEDARQFELSFLPSYTRQRFSAKLRLAAGAVLDPDAKPVAPIRCGLETRPDVIHIEVPARHRGKTWCIAGSGYCLISMNGIPPYISPSYETFHTEPRVPKLDLDN